MGIAKAVASLSAASVAGVAVQCGGRRRGLQRLQMAALLTAQMKPSSETLTELVEQKSRQTCEEIEGKQIGGLICPCCGGGDNLDLAFSVKVESDHFLYKCFRTKCGVSGCVKRRSSGAAPGQLQRRSAHSGFTSSVASTARAEPPVPQRDVAKPLHLGDVKPLAGELLDYMVQKRHISETVLQRNGVVQKTLHSTCKETRRDVIVFPYRVGGKVEAAKYRDLPKAFWQAPGGKSVLYGVDDLKGQDTIILVEGEIDKLSVETAGLLGVASLQDGAAGGVSLEFGAKEAFQAARRIVIATDCDEAGQNAVNTIARLVQWHKCYRVVWRNGCKDANEVLLEHGVAAVREDIDGAKPLDPPPAIKYMSSVEEAILAKLSGQVPDEMVRGVSTGWTCLDRLYRVVPGELTVVTGVPGSGKSEWLMSLIYGLAERRGWRFLLYNFESTLHTQQLQLLEKRLRRPYKEIRKDDEKTNAVWQWADEHLILGEDLESPHIDDILKDARIQATSEDGLGGLVIDPYNYIVRRRGEDIETNFINSMLAKLKRFAAEYSCHVWIVAHPAKKSSWTCDERPSLYDIAGSANWFNKCDMGIIVNRLSVEVGGELCQTRRIELTLEKVRNKEAGSLGSCELLFEHRSRSYSEAPPDEGE